MKTTMQMKAMVAAAMVGAAASAATFKDGDRVVFLGDSITAGNAYAGIMADYYLTRFPDRDVRFVNSGNGGDVARNAATAMQMEDRVFSRNPTAVSVMFGINDCWRVNFAPEPTEKQVAAREGQVARYAESLHCIVTNVQARCGGIPVYLLSPHPWDDNSRILADKNPEGSRYPEFYGKGAGIGRFAQAVRDEAERTVGTTFVDCHAAVSEFFRARRAANPDAVFAGDRTHPGADVHLRMALAFLQAQNAERVVSDIALQGTNALKAVRAEVTDAEALPDGGVAFTVLEKSLPWVFPAKWAASATNDPQVASLDQQIVAFYSLPEGDWTLRIDGKEVATHTAWEWENGVNLAFNPKTPQFAQAQRVREAREKFWGWKSFAESTQSRIRREVWMKMGKAGLDPASADDRAKFLDGLKLNPWDVKSWNKTFENWDRIDEMRDEALAGCPEVRALAKPTPHRYELGRSGKKEVRSTK